MEEVAKQHSLQSVSQSDDQIPYQNTTNLSVMITQSFSTVDSSQIYPTYSLAYCQSPVIVDEKQTNSKRKLIEDVIDVKLTAEELNQIGQRLKNVFSVQKTPTQVLHELFPGGKKVTIENKGTAGPSHNPSHTTYVTVEKIGTFCGESKSKQEAKQKAAKKAIDYLIMLIPRYNVGNGKKCRITTPSQDGGQSQAIAFQQSTAYPGGQQYPGYNYETYTGQYPISYAQDMATQPYYCLTSLTMPVGNQLQASSSVSSDVAEPSQKQRGKVIKNKEYFQNILEKNKIIKDQKKDLDGNTLSDNENALIVDEQEAVCDADASAHSQSDQETTEDEEKDMSTSVSEKESPNSQQSKMGIGATEQINYQEYIQPYLLDDDLATLIYQAVHNKWNELFSPVNMEHLIQANSDLVNYYLGRKLWLYREMAAFVVTSQNDPQYVEVLSLGSGTKCISSENFSLSGDVIHDCHAEVIARRGLMCVLYEQLQVLLDQDPKEAMNRPNIILEPVGEPVQRFRLKEHLRIHLYITSPPCGDCRIFNFNNTSRKVERRSHVKGLLRVKVEKGQGSIPMSDNYIATWDGILASQQRVTFMSCSDKIALWNVVGVQGALLSMFLEPLYINSLVISNLFRPVHLLRGVHGRINDRRMADGLCTESGYRVNKHKIGSAPISRDMGKGNCAVPTYSHNWYLKVCPNVGNSWMDLEIIDSERGINFFSTNVSRLCKLALLERFKLLVVMAKVETPTLAELRKNFDLVVIIESEKQPQQQQSINASCDDNTDDIASSKVSKVLAENEIAIPRGQDALKKSYYGLKQAANDYFRMKTLFFQTMHDTGLGTWVSQPPDLDKFDLNN